jgi:hypothetical protein
MWKSKKLFFTLIAALLALLVAAPLVSSPTLTTPINALLASEPGHLGIGDTWTYNMPLNATANQTMTRKVVGIVSVQDWNGTMVKCYKMKMDIPNPMVNVTFQHSYLRISDQKQIAKDYYSLWNASGSYIETYTFSYTNEPVENGYPLSLMTTWNQTIIMNTTGYSNTWIMGPWMNITTDRSNAMKDIFWQAGEVLNISNVTVPAGIFETWRINITNNMSGSVNWYFSPTVKNFVKMTNSTGGFLYELVSYSFGQDTTMMLLLLLYQQQQQQATTMTYIYVGAGLGIIALVALGIILWRRGG